MREPRTPASTWLLTLCGIASLLLIEEPATAFVLSAMSLLAVWAVLSRRTRARLPRVVARATDLVVATSVVGLATTHFAFGRATLSTLGYVLIVGQLSRASRRKRPSDLAVMHGTAIAQLCLAAFLTRADEPVAVTARGRIVSQEGGRYVVVSAGDQGATRRSSVAAQWSISRKAFEANLDTQAGRSTTADRHCGAGGQGSPTGRGLGAEPDLRRGLSGFQLRIPPKA